jgi:hypothetical protein
MLMRCERRGQLEIGDSDFEYYFYADLRPEATRGLRRAERLVPEQPHKCDSCGETTADVDLWAENSETGEQIWLCMTCAGW